MEHFPLLFFSLRRTTLWLKIRFKNRVNTLLSEQVRAISLLILHFFILSCFPSSYGLVAVVGGINKPVPLLAPYDEADLVLLWALFPGVDYAVTSPFIFPYFAWSSGKEIVGALIQLP